MSAITTRTVVAMTPEGLIEVKSHTWEGPARRRWKAVALTLAALLFYGSAIGLWIAAFRWDGARQVRLGELQALADSYRVEVVCWRKLARQRTRVVSWLDEAKWVQNCIEAEEKGR